MYKSTFSKSYRMLYKMLKAHLVTKKDLGGMIFRLVLSVKNRNLFIIFFMYKWEANKYVTLQNTKIIILLDCF